MILTRLGSKRSLASKIQLYFPPHITYLEPFFGAGGMFFYKPKARHNFLNDIDSDVFNLFQVVMRKKDKLIEVLKQTPQSSDLFNYWVKNQESDDILKAVRFLILSNSSHMGLGHVMSLGSSNTIYEILNKLEETQQLLFGSKFTNYDFRVFFKNIQFRHPEREIKESFVYCDPPYLGTLGYQTDFDEKDSADLFEVLMDTGMNFAVSEYNHPFVLEQARKHHLTVNHVVNRISITKRKSEILITNYKPNRLLFGEEEMIEKEKS